MDEYQDPGTKQVFALGRNEPTAQSKLMRSTMQNFTTYLGLKGLSLIPRSQWKPIDRRTTLGTEFINYQRQFGACVGASGVQALTRIIALRGFKLTKLSWGMLYDQINGGQDHGAIITDAMKALENVGVCTEAEYPVPKFNTRFPQSALDTAKRFRLTQALTLSTFDEIGTALQMGFIPQFPVCVGRNFGSFDADGVCGFTRGPGNHSVHADGMKLSRSGQWLLDMPNSWDLGWGDQGRAFLSEQHIAGAGSEDDAYTHIAETLDPQDMPPVIA